MGLPKKMSCSMGSAPAGTDHYGLCSGLAQWGRSHFLPDETTPANPTLFDSLGTTGSKEHGKTSLSRLARCYE